MFITYSSLQNKIQKYCIISHKICLYTQQRTTRKSLVGTLLRTRKAVALLCKPFATFLKKFNYALTEIQHSVGKFVE